MSQTKVDAVREALVDALRSFAKFACMPLGSCAAAEASGPCHNCAALLALDATPPEPTTHLKNGAGQ